MNAVVDGHHQSAGNHQGTLMVRDVNDVGTLLPQCQRKGKVIPPRPGLIGLRKLHEVFRKRTKFLKIPIGSGQEVFVLEVDLREIANEVPDIRSDPEFIDSSDIDCDAHDTAAAIIMKTC